jgi:hypothetical protein
VGVEIQGGDHEQYFEYISGILYNEWKLRMRNGAAQDPCVVERTFRPTLLHFH